MTEKMTKQPKKQKTKDRKYCFEPNIRSNLHLVNFDVLIEKVKMMSLTENFNTS